MIKVINEKWPAVIDQNISEKGKRELAGKLINLGFDIENTDNELIRLSSNRDPRIKDGLIIVKFNKPNTYKKDPVVGVWFNGKCILDPVVGRDGWKDVQASWVSWKKILDMDIDVYRMVLDPEKAKAMADKRKERLASQKGVVSRYGADPNSYGMRSLDGTNKSALGTSGRYGSRRLNIDKSGYIVNPSKYKDMLAELQINGAQEILNKAADTYQKLAANITKYGTDSNWGFDSYEYCMSRILNCFRDLKNTMKEMNDENSSPYSRDYTRGKVKSLLKDIREIMKTAEKYLD